MSIIACWVECSSRNPYREGLGHPASLSLPVPKDQKLPQSFSKLPAVKQELSFEFIKGQLFHGRLESVECEELTRYCSKLQPKTSGTKGELSKDWHP